ncbi:cell wall-binding repeat-containing protein [Herbiconiux liukaitaii]|uniref:cell wall-binding repeat-containing protein n=1 Tax=Herbiconiux liukaitaii TaxID=3342799 RepID=UPI0035B87304
MQGRRFKFGFSAVILTFILVVGTAAGASGGEAMVLQGSEAPEPTSDVVSPSVPLEAAENDSYSTPPPPSSESPVETDKLQAAATGVVAGRISLAAGLDWIAGDIQIKITDPTGTRIKTLTVQRPGQPFETELAPGSYLIWPVYKGPANFARDQRLPFSIAAGTTTTVEPVLVTGGVVTGTVTETSGLAAAEGYVYAAELGWERTETFKDFGRQYDPATGTYEISKIPTGTFRVCAGWATGAGQTSCWQYPDRPATPLEILAGQRVDGIHLVLDSNFGIAGVITYVDVLGDVRPAEKVRVTMTAYGEILHSSLTDQNGRYRLRVNEYESGEIVLSRSDDESAPDWVTESRGSISVPEGPGPLMQDFTATLGGRVTGEVTSASSTGGNYGSWAVSVSRWDESTSAWGAYSSPVSATERYGVYGLASGTYRVRFADAKLSDDANPALRFRTQYYNDSLFEAEADSVGVRAGAAVDGINAQMRANATATERIGGQDRYEVAANISEKNFSPRIPVLYVASGENYPDALSAGPAAAHQQGGLLLVARDSIPRATQAEILRLQPEKIVVVGGPASVSPSVYAALSSLAPSIQRIGGTDRYEVSRNLISYAFCGGAVLFTDCDASGVSTLFVATGEKFPDALTAGPAAAHLGTAVLLVPGSHNALDPVTPSFLDNLGVTKTYIAGGKNTVSPGVGQSIVDWGLTVTRLAGTDRYDVAAIISREIFASSDRVYVASGAVFADALSGGPAAAASGAPMLLTAQGCVPQTTSAALASMDPAKAWFLGGPNTIAESVLSLEPVCSY